MSTKQIVEIRGVDIRAETANAILIYYKGFEYWIPYSQIDKVERNNKAPNLSAVVMTEWIARTKNIPY